MRAANEAAHALGARRRVLCRCVRDARTRAAGASPGPEVVPSYGFTLWRPRNETRHEILNRRLLMGTFRGGVYPGYISTKIVSCRVAEFYFASWRLRRAPGEVSPSVQRRHTRPLLFLAAPLELASAHPAPAAHASPLVDPRGRCVCTLGRRQGTCFYPPPELFRSRRMQQPCHFPDTC